MAYHVEVTEPALHDLRAIYEFVSADKTQHTEDWFIGLREAVFSLERLPHRGTLIESRPSIRRLLYGNKPHVYQILYTVNRRLSRVTILHIRHSARNVLTSD